MERRQFIKNGMVSSIGIGLAGNALAGKISANKPGNTLKVGIIGVGNRGTSLMRDLLKIDDVEIVAVCDLFKDNADRAVGFCNKEGEYLND